MKIEQFNIIPIYEEGAITGFEISVNNHRIDEVGYTIKNGVLAIKNFKLSEK